MRPTKRLAPSLSTLTFGALLLGLGCGSRELPPAPITSHTQADFINGGFELGDLTGWTASSSLNNSIGVFPPTKISDLTLAAGGTMRTYVRMGDMLESQIPSGLTAADTLRYPKFGKYSVVVNEMGSSDNVNRIVQQMTTTAADVDAVDGRIHVRFALAPVLQNPSHSPNQQPYFYLELRNVTKNLVLFSSFNFSGQPGVPWKENAAGTAIQYTDWQLFDVAPGPTGIAIGDTVRMEAIAAGCSQGGHWGHLYLDAFGAYIPGLTVAATGPQSANAGSEITYTFNAKNGGTGGAANVIVKETLPPGTTFVSVSGATCTAPAVGGTGTLSCNVGTLNPGAGVTFKVTVRIDPGATGTINNGTYSIEGTGVSPLIGPLVQTAITSGVTYTDLGITVSNSSAALDWGSPVSYKVVATNTGPTAVTGARLSNTLPPELTGVTWTCAGTNGGVCGAQSGSGALNATADLPVGASVTYTVSGSVGSGTGMATLSYLVSIATPAGVVDGNTTNNNAVEIDNVGPIVTLSVNKGDSTGFGSIISSPAAIACDAGCTTQSAQFLGGSSVTLTAVAAAGSTFTGWGGACADKGTQQQCTVTLNAAQTVSAGFALPSYNITVQVDGGHGTITCPSPAVQGRSVVCTITPEPGYAIDTLTVDGMDLRPTVSGNGFTIENVQGDRTVLATFKKGPGAECSDAAECSSGFCQSGVCCDQACTGGCQACNVSGQAGTCTSACGNFACNAAQDACYSSCTSNAECLSGGVCMNGDCMPPSDDKIVLSGGGFSACAYGDARTASAGAVMAVLAASGLLLLRRRRPLHTV